MKLQRLTMIVGALVITSISFGQKKNETSAAVEYLNKYVPAYAKQDFDGAKKALLSAKSFIDLAAVNPETQESPKTQYYKGEIYSAAVFIAFQTGDTAFASSFGQDAFEQSIENFSKSYSASSKYRIDIDNSIAMKSNMIAPLMNVAYDAGKYDEAGELYYFQYQLLQGKNIKDSISLYNAGLCYDKGGNTLKAAKAYEELTTIGYKGAMSYALAGSLYAKLKEFDKAKSILNTGRAKYGNDKDLLLELVKLNIAQGDAKGAESALNEAILKDPYNKQLHYIIGTIYTDLGENEKAETALNKALELDPNYLDAQYNLGAHLVTWGSALKQEANQMELGDPKYNLTLQQSEDVFKRALVPLEKYIITEPKDKNVLMILYQLYHNLGNDAKSAEYKARYDAVK